MRVRGGLLGKAVRVSVVLSCGLLSMAPARAQQIAITFDDLPAHGPLPPGETRTEVASQVIHALRRAHVPPVYGFVNGQIVQQQPDTGAVLAAWRGAGFWLGNHTWSHMDLARQSVPQFGDDVTKNEPLLKLQMDGHDWHWLRFPYLSEGDTDQKKMGIRVFLAEHGYKIAGVTMSFADYEWNEPYARCSAKHEGGAISRLEHTYLKAAQEDIRYTRELSKTLYQRDIAYVLLMHLGAFDARMLPRLLDLYQRRGFTFISLEEAEKDPFYRYDVDPKLLPGPDTLEAAMLERHLPLPPHQDYQAELDRMCR
jgi:peptidoglycan-N-acetylglucosamine deacetylase